MKLSKKGLLFLASICWAFAGCLLIARSLHFLIFHQNYIEIKLIIGLVSGLLFYWFLFKKIANKYAIRIISMEEDKLFFAKFMSLKGYIIMFSMISASIIIRKLQLVDINYFSVFYIIMGVPLFLSAMYFFKTGIRLNYKKKYF